jgi:hypothetical protein
LPFLSHVLLSNVQTSRLSHLSRLDGKRAP